mmetsp:Transcript_20413/g.30552  ORF Transcript_20413/g.30552 Transcript_20413/m.30552 type:complete len:587 (-) Transcript_20413:119-1879(-)
MTPNMLEDIIYLCTNDLGPAFEGINLKIGGATISWGVMESTGVSRQRMRNLYKKHGDLGDIAYACRAKQRVMFQAKTLTISDVRNELLAIAKEEGSGSVTRRKKRILRLLTRCRSVEIRWIVRTLCLHLRTGATRKTCLSALAQAKVLNDKRKESDKKSIEITTELKEEIKQSQTLVAEAFNRRPDLGVIVKTLINPESTFLAVKDIQISLGLPVCCMLANPTKSISQIMELHGTYEDTSSVAQYKYDGQRAQIHFSARGNHKMFSRHNDDISRRFPEVFKSLDRSLKLGEDKKLVDCILDAEVCGVERKEGKTHLMAFQQLSTRKKEQDSNRGQSGVPVCLFIFDIMYVDGKSLVDETLSKRREAMKKLFHEIPGEVEFAKERDCKDESQMEEFFKESIEAGCEGLMVKLLSSKYSPGKRENTWLKLKKDYSDTMGDSIDVVPIGAWYGNGRKAGWFSPFLLAVWDPDMEQYQTLCRCISGFTDDFYKSKTEFFKKNIIEANSTSLIGEAPSLWFKPSEVWEIRGAELTVSPVHKAAEGLLDDHPFKGLSLRFPRFIRVRDDKSITDTTSPQQLAEMFISQRRRA